MKLFGESDIAGIGGPSQVESDRARAKLNLAGVKHVLAIASAKGGVGKSALLTNLAAVLAVKGRKVGLLDADLNAPSVPAMLGMQRTRLFSIGGEIDPASGPLGLRLVASNLLAESEPPPLSFTEGEPPAINNGARPEELTKPQMLRRLFAQTRFGALDFLLVDVAPGLGEMDLVARIAPLAGIVLITHPSQLGVPGVKSALEVAARAATPIIAIIENMTSFYCESCHSVRPLLPQADLVGQLRGKGPAIIGRLAFDPRLAEACDRGAIFVKEYPDAPLAKQLAEVAARLEEMLGVHARHARV
jgi:ATP-binding protein involved in chromosome partitioning